MSTAEGSGKTSTLPDCATIAPSLCFSARACHCQRPALNCVESSAEMVTEKSVPLADARTSTVGSEGLLK